MLQQETIAHHEHVTVMPESRTNELRPGMLDDIALMLGRQFSVYNAACQSALADKLGIPLADLKALELVMEFDALPTGQLAQLMGISSGGATALINRLEAAGYVQRGRHPLDRRMIVIRPVEEQCQHLAQERQWVADAVMLMARRYDTTELETVHAFLAQCVRALRHDTLVWLETPTSHHEL
ncbi:MarR family transcriptional regulator [Achromobacter sp. LC458]|uniref:MarR family transcriptional regulator n=1 Tax=Achromobacter spanius TaxID=217203 RepID=A0A2S5GQ33_9BURK|nr:MULTISPECIES: MarR family transcriptional regulator [Achromobacter]AYD65608.1 MarR family transcriptional regulator [Achromobacter sp. B7]MDX3985422.1 MarR family transcriptional regulator [Achromobacter sp.]PPA74961.1 MarR family transcriptional regulator [Achromobacter spanius]QYJ19743.1 MarR family transcriptional regulator [Achromobacter sp. ES-001]TRM52930.1 MarR family transcriptional regulator [Achromobacter sp. LC458]